MILQQILKDYGTLLIFAAQVAWFVVVWWFRKSVATKEDVAAVVTTVAAAVNRIEQLEVDRDNAPDARDMEALRLEMSHHTGQMREFSATFSGKCETLDAKFKGLGHLVDRAENMISTLTNHMLANNR